MPDELSEQCALVADSVGDAAEAWDVAGQLPENMLRELGSKGLLCLEVPTAYGGAGSSSEHNGQFTAYVGSLCSSLRSVMTSQAMAAWTIQRVGLPEQQHEYLTQLTDGRLAAVGFSEPGAGSDLSTMATEIRRDGDSVVVDGHKVWVTAADYADLLLIFGRYSDGSTNDGTAAIVVPTTAPGVRREKVSQPLGCRAAGHAHVRLDSVRLPAANLLGGGGQPLTLLVTTALTYGRMSVAWGCLGIIRACLKATTGHAASRTQFGKPLSQHQLVARHLAELFVSEQVSARVCEHASRCWDSRSPEMVVSAMLAKYVSSSRAAQGAASAVQVLASSGAVDGQVVARAYRDAKLMEIIEGSSEICQLLLAQHALDTVW